MEVPIPYLNGFAYFNNGRAFDDPVCQSTGTAYGLSARIGLSTSISLAFQSRAHWCLSAQAFWVASAFCAASCFECSRDYAL